MNELQCLIEFFNRYTILTPEDTDLLRGLVRFESYGRNEFVLSQHQVCNRIWFVKSGMLRKYHLSDGKEVTDWIHFENEMVTSMNSFFKGIVCNEFLQACEKCELISITRENSEKLSGSLAFNVFNQKFLSEQLALLEISSSKSRLMDAKEKYEYLGKVAPQLIKRAKLGHIASIMGVTQETLSRIRKQQ